MELRDGNGYSSGNVFALNSNGYLGPVCDDDWSDVAATVVCKQLGFSSGIARWESAFGSVPTQHAMDDVQCTGDEDTIQQCTYSLNENCDSTEGAGVECSYSPE